MSDRSVALAFTARLTDEVLSGAWTVLTPTFRRAFGLSLVQVGLLSQVLSWVALVVEPVAAALIDVSARRVLLGAGALALGISTLTMGAAPSYAVLLLAFGIYGLGSGPLAHTADVVVVEAFPDSPERAYTRATFLDTIGAFTGPALVGLAALVGMSWRIVLVGLGVVTLVYAGAIARTDFGGPAQGRRSRPGLATEMVGNIRTVLRDRRARRLLLVLFWFDVFEAAFVLKYVWLHDHVGLSEPMVAAYAAAEQVVDLVALVCLDRWLVRWRPQRILAGAAAALVVLPTVWVAVPGVAGRLLLGVPLAFAHTLIWPLAKAQSLTAVPALAGATQAVTALFPLVPLLVVQAVFAEQVGTGAAMAATATIAAALMAVSARHALPASTSS